MDRKSWTHDYAQMQKKSNRSDQYLTKYGHENGKSLRADYFQQKRLNNFMAVSPYTSLLDYIRLYVLYKNILMPKNLKAYCLWLLDYSLYCSQFIVMLF